VILDIAWVKVIAYAEVLISLRLFEQQATSV
jgi:hypothetical protein